jgi:hypothetical protein
VIVALQGCVIVALQCCVIVVLQGCMIVVLQGCDLELYIQGRFFATIFESHVNNTKLLKTVNFPHNFVIGNVRKVA